MLRTSKRKPLLAEISEYSLEKLVLSIIHNPIPDKASNLINYLVLEMISAYDNQLIKSDKLINSAELICKYLYDNDTEQSSIHLINLFQIKKRKVELSEIDRSKLSSIYQEGNIVLNFCIEVLLDHKVEAEKLLELLNANEQKEISWYPIMHLYKHLKQIA